MGARSRSGKLASFAVPLQGDCEAAPRLSDRQEAWLLIRNAEVLDDKQKVAWKTLLEESSIAAQAGPLAQAYRQMINERQGAELNDPMAL